MKLIQPMAVADAQLVSSNVLENDYTAWSALTAYVVGNRCMIIAVDTHLIYESIQNGTNKPPATNATYWKLVGATNRWKLHDGSVTSQTVNADSIDNVYLASGRVNAVSVLNVSASQIRIKMTDAIDGLVYDRTFSMTSDSGITDWYSFFSEPIVRKVDFYTDDLPGLYSNPTIEVIIGLPGETVAAGALVMGYFKEIGATQQGAKTGIRDYSKKIVDEFGNYTVLERSFAKTGEFTVWVENAYKDTLEQQLAEFRAIPIVYVGSDAYTSTILYGFYLSFSVVISGPTHSLLSIQIEGLT